MVSSASTSCRLAAIGCSLHLIGTCSQLGIIGWWQPLLGGIQLTLLLTKCDKPNVCTSQCTTMWLMTQDCAILNESHIFANVLSVSDGLAQLQVVAHARALADSTYNFTLFLPTPNNATNQTVAKIEGIFTVSGNPSCSPGSERAPLSFPIGAKQCLKCEPGLYNLGGDVCHVILHAAPFCFGMLMCMYVACIHRKCASASLRRCRTAYQGLTA